MWKRERDGEGGYQYRLQVGNTEYCVARRFKECEYEEGDWGIHIATTCEQYRNGAYLGCLTYCSRQGNYRTAREAREAVEESLEWDD
jgi:hypothetical protein